MNSNNVSIKAKATTVTTDIAQLVKIKWLTFREFRVKNGFKYF